MKRLFADSPPSERIKLLRDNCDSHEETTYYKDLTPEELEFKREAFVENASKLNQMEEELSDIKKDFKQRIDPIKEENKALLVEVRTRKARVTGQLFHMANHEDGMMETYDENGDLVSTRRLRPDEKQGRLFIAAQAKTAEG